MNMNTKKGFTLIELMVVIAIIGILATIITASLGSARAKGRDAKRIADLKSVQTALANYYLDNDMYPTNIYGTSGATAAPAKGLAPTYMPVVPTDPGFGVSGSSCQGASYSTGGCYGYQAYAYVTTGATTIVCNATTNLPTKYHIGVMLEQPENSALLQDADAPASQQDNGINNMTNFAVCRQTGSGDFDGTSAPPSPKTARCTSAAGVAQGQASATEQCYDMTP